MTLFGKIRSALEKGDACTISRSGSPQYIAMRWERYQELMQKLQTLDSLRKQVDEEGEDGDYDVDINTIPV